MYEIDEDDEDGDSVIVEITVEWYLRHRDDPIMCLTAIRIPKMAFEHGAAAIRESLQEGAEQQIMFDLDSKGTNLLPIPDLRGNRLVVNTNEVQAVSILAPDMDTLVRLQQEIAENG